MEFDTFECEGLVLIKPKVFSDNRGYFLETYRLQKYSEIGIGNDFVQDNESMSHKFVLRGLHFQIPPYAQGKLIRVISGSIFDVAVDIRKILPHTANGNRFYFPLKINFNFGFRGLHGFLSLEDNTIINYKCTADYNASAERTLHWNDRFKHQMAGKSFNSKCKR